MTRLGIHFFSLFFVLALAGCSNSGTNEATRAVEGDSYRDLGPWDAGVTTLTLADRQVEVWYPVNPADTEGLEPAPKGIAEQTDSFHRRELPPISE